MAAHCRKMASRSFVQFLSCSRFSVLNAGCRHLSLHRTVPQPLQSDRESSCWGLMAAVCLQRLPVISTELDPVEQKFNNMIQQIELEKSLLSDHELRLLEDADRMSRKQSEDYDSDDEESHGDQEIMQAQDLEDTWEQKLKSFQPAPRVRADVDKDLTSVDRCLADTLVLLAQQQVGDEKLWLLPQTSWKEGETLRQTAERALAAVPASGFKATFLGNAPCGVYKYKLPKAMRTQSLMGMKVFFFKAILNDGDAAKHPNASLLWVKKNELQNYLKPAYFMKVDRFILDL